MGAPPNAPFRVVRRRVGHPHTVFGIRHHGPGSARSLERALGELQPDAVLIEGPPEGDALLPLASEAEPPAFVGGVEAHPELARRAHRTDNEHATRAGRLHVEERHGIQIESHFERPGRLVASRHSRGRLRRCRLCAEELGLVGV